MEDLREEGNVSRNDLTNASSLGKLLSECFVQCTCGRDSTNKKKKKKKKPHKDTCRKKTDVTHTLMDGGTLCIPRSKRKEFQRRYDREIWRPSVSGGLVDSPLFGNKQCDTFVEKIGDACYRMYFDLDIPTVGSSAMKERELKAIAREFTTTMRSLLDSTVDLALVTYSCKPKYKPNVRGEMIQQIEEELEDDVESTDSTNRMKWKNGLHIHYPFAIVNKTLNHSMMKAVLPLLRKEHPNRLWDKWLDPECWNTGLRIDGCRKALRGPKGIMCYENERYSPLMVSSINGAEEETWYLDEMKNTSRYLMVLPMEEESIRRELWDPSLLEAGNPLREPGGDSDDVPNPGRNRNGNAYLPLDEVLIPMLQSRLELELGYYTESIGKSSPSCYLFSPTTNEVECPLGRFLHVSHGCSVHVLADGKVTFRCLSKRCRQFDSKELRRIDLNDASLEEFVDGSYLVFEPFTPAFQCSRKNVTSYEQMLRPSATTEEIHCNGFRRIKVRSEDVMFWGKRYQEIVPIHPREGERLPSLTDLLTEIRGEEFPDRMAISVRSSIDTGKTTMVNRYIRDADERGIPLERILMISVRQSMTDDLVRNFGPLGFVDYRDYRQNTRLLRQQKRLILQIDSIHRLRSTVEGFSLPEYDLVVFDEVSYGLQHFSYKDMENKMENVRLLQDYIVSTPRIITMDADHGYKATDFLTHQREDFVLVWNGEPPPTRKHVFMYRRKGTWYNRLYGVLQKGEKVAVPINSKRTAKAIRDTIVKKNLVNPERILLICSESTKEERDLLKDCNAAFLQYDVIIYTPSIGPGVDFHQDHFHHIFAFGVRCSNTATDFVQGISRIRRAELIHLYVGPDGYPRDQDLVTGAGLTRYMSWSMERVKNIMGMEYFTQMDPITKRYYFPSAKDDAYFRLIFNNRLDIEDSKIRFQSIVREKFESMNYVIEDVDETVQSSEVDREMDAEAEKEMRAAEKEVTKRKHEEIMSVEVTEKPPPKAARYDEPLTAANMAFYFNQTVSVRDAHRIPEFYERHKDLYHIFRATRMIQTDEEAEKEDLDRMNRDRKGVDPSSLISGRLGIVFKKCVQDVLDIYGWKSLFDQKEVDPPDISRWNDHPNRREICQTLGLDENKKYKNAMGPIRNVLKKHFLLKVTKKQKRSNGSKIYKYAIGKDEQQELYQLLRNKHRNKELGTRLEEMETKGTFIIDANIATYWLQLTSPSSMEPERLEDTTS